MDDIILRLAMITVAALALARSVPRIIFALKVEKRPSLLRKW